MNGVLTCAKYAFAPNFYQYCGPDRNQEVKSYLESHQVDQNLAANLKEFDTLYSYLQAIAQANQIQDPFDPRVVEAYWVGNDLLLQVEPEKVYQHLTQGLLLPKRVPAKELKWLYPKIDQGAFLHHSFHVFNVFTRTGHHTVNHTVETMDSCRIGWGRVIAKMKDERLKINGQRIFYVNSRLEIQDNVEREIEFSVVDSRVRVGDWVTYHWGFYCDRVSAAQVKQLEKYTKYHLQMANETL